MHYVVTYWLQNSAFTLLLCLSSWAYGASDTVRLYNQLLPDAPRLTDGYIQVDNTRYHYVTAGEGPLVILHHGFPAFWYIWKHQVAALSQHYRVVALDGLGSNLSDRPASPQAYSIATLAHQLNQIALQLGDNKPFILIGHDWGGALAWAFAQAYPDRLRKLAVLNAPPYNLFLDLLRHNEEQQKTSRYVKALQSKVVEMALSAGDAYLLWKSAYQKAVEEQWLSSEEGAHYRTALATPGAITGSINWYRANIPTHRDIEPSDYWPAGNTQIQAPSLLIWGEKDKTFVPAFMEQLPDYAANLTIEIIASAGHKPSISHPQEVNRLLMDFLSQPQAETSEARITSYGKITPEDMPQQ